MIARLGTGLLLLGGVLMFGVVIVLGEDSSDVDSRIFGMPALVCIGAGVALRVAARQRTRGEHWYRVESEERQARPAEAAWRGRRSVASLGRVETRELLVSSWFMLGLAFWVLELVMFGILFNTDHSGHWWETGSALTLAVHPLVGLTMVATHRAVSRARRDGCTELFDACPMPQGERLLAHLTSAAVAAPITSLSAAVLFFLILRQDAIFGSLDSRLWFALATCGVFGAGAVALGTALGRWVPFALSPVVALFAIMQIDSRILSIGGERWATDNYLAMFDPGDTPEPALLDLPLAGQLAWFTFLTIVVAGVALLWCHRSALPLIGVGVAGAIAAALVVVAPMPDATDKAALLQNPGAHETCRAIDEGRVTVCATDEYAAILDRLSPSLAPTVAALPADTEFDSLLRVDLLRREYSLLPAELAALVPVEPVPPPHVVLVAPSSSDAARLSASLQLALHQLGLPTRSGVDQRPMSLAGRADGVAALWLGTRGLTDAERRAAMTVRPDDHVDEVVDATTYGQVWPDVCESGPAPTVWAPEDVEAAVRLNALDNAVVLRTLHDNWDDLDTMTTDDLLVLAGVEPVGPTSAIEERPDVCPW